MKTNFRSLKAEEVDVRPAEAKGSKATLLLYQDARCAMNILDEYVGPENWQKEYYEAKGLLFCRIGIRDDSGGWIWKADTGSESNIEADKGLASDAFKRAAVAWGIGRELYTAPRITVELTDKDMFNGKLSQTFRVSEMEVGGGVITKLVVVDKIGVERYRYNSTSTSKPQPVPTQELKDCTPNEKILKDFCSARKKEPDIDLGELKRFFDFYMSPDRDASTSIINTWKGHLKPEILWEKWLRQKTNLTS